MKKYIKPLFSLGPASIAVLCLTRVLILFLIGIPILDLIELKTYDLRFLSRGIKKPASEVVLAVIDEKSLDREGRWP
jgi:adenylate cyclase